MFNSELEDDDKRLFETYFDCGRGRYAHFSPKILVYWNFSEFTSIGHPPYQILSVIGSTF